jgi:hypothetical protein
MLLSSRRTTPGSFSGDLRSESGRNLRASLIRDRIAIGAASPRLAPAFRHINNRIVS